MTETNKMRDPLATLRDALQKLEANLGAHRGRCRRDRQPGRMPPRGCRSVGRAPAA